MATLDFEGYFLPGDVEDIPKVHGIYAAFTCKETLTGLEGRLVYIGMADKGDTVRSRIKDHIDGQKEAPSGKQCNWERWYCGEGESIVYAYAAYDGTDLEDVEKALIYRNQPLANEYHKDKYNGKKHPILVSCKGKIATLREMVYIE